jgi:pSer/pThr/pTyr-binding forkhead associated (FHA) protein
LVTVSGPAEGRPFSLEQPEVCIGADSSSDLRIEDDEYVSGRHALVRYHSGSLYLSDLGSRNGTFLNDERLGATAAVLALGDTIRVGTTSFRLKQTEV